MESALEGFPAAVLLGDCLMVDGRGGADDQRAQQRVVHILTQWATMIERDLERFPPATIEVLQTIRQRMLDARYSSLRLRSLSYEVSEFAPNRAEPDEWLRTSTRESGRALPDALNQFEREATMHDSPRPAGSAARWPAMAATQPPACQAASARP
jgi:hypothetical protein